MIFYQVLYIYTLIFFRVCSDPYPNMASLGGISNLQKQNYDFSITMAKAGSIKESNTLS
jgi:hypothetical protein